MSRLLLIASAVLAFALSACSDHAGHDGTSDSLSREDALATINQQEIYAHLEYLASDELAGRMTGEPGYEMAASYVAEQFAAMGLAPGGTDEWYQPVPLQSNRVVDDSMSLTIHREDGDTQLKWIDDFITGGDKVRPTTRLSGELVYVGFGVHAPQFGYTDFADIDIAGKIAVATYGGPDTIPGEELAHLSSTDVKAEEMVARGAVGTLVLYPRSLLERFPYDSLVRAYTDQPGMAWVDSDGAAADFFPELNGRAWLSPDAATALFAGTPISYEEALDKGEASEPASVALGISATLDRESTHEQLSSPNVIGIVRGTDPELADEYIVYSAHLDHIGRGQPVDDDEIYNGMYDNAMGIAIMLETARALAAAPPRRSVMFIALAAEEVGLLGSDYFANYPTVPRDAIVANINIDMPLLLYPNADLVAFGAEHSSLHAVATAAAEAEDFVLTPDPTPEENSFTRSDQYSFVKRGIPAIYLNPGYGSKDPEVDGEAVTTAYRRTHYHKPSDDLTQPINWDSALRLARANTRIAWEIADNDARPTWNDGSFFGETFAQQ